MCYDFKNKLGLGLDLCVCRIMSKRKPRATWVMGIVHLHVRYIVRTYPSAPALDSRVICSLLVCKKPLLARALGLKAMPSARATIGYLVYE